MKIAKKILQLIGADVVFSDLQIKPGFKLSYRSPRGYQSYGDDNLTQQDIEEFANFADKNWVANLEKGKGQFDTSFTLQGAARLRCNFFRFGHGNDLGIVARKHPMEIPEIGTLGAPAKLRHLVNIRSKGLILVTGPFGSGKSTTIASLLEHINNTMAASIVTLEDPIEYQMESKKSIVTQREIPTNVATFSDGLMAAKRQRPDIIMVGEMRDRDTIEAGIMAADSGCLVMASSLIE